MIRTQQYDVCMLERAKSEEHHMLATRITLFGSAMPSIVGYGALLVVN